MNIVTVIKLTISISNFQIIYTYDAKKISKINVSSYKLRPWFTKGDAPPSKTCKFDLINGEAHSNVSGFSDRTLAECYKSILPNFQNDTETTMCSIFHQADISAGARRIDLGKSNLWASGNFPLLKKAIFQFVPELSAGQPLLTFLSTDELLQSPQSVKKSRKLYFWTYFKLFLKGDVASRIESQKLNDSSNFNSVVCELCRISLWVIERHRDASKLRILN